MEGLGFSLSNSWVSFGVINVYVCKTQNCVIFEIDDPIAIHVKGDSKIKVYVFLCFFGRKSVQYGILAVCYQWKEIWMTN